MNVDAFLGHAIPIARWGAGFTAVVLAIVLLFYIAEFILGSLGVSIVTLFIIGCAIRCIYLQLAPTVENEVDSN